MKDETNGAPRAGEGQAWSPAQRKLWLQKMEAPADFVLLTTLEMMKMSESMSQTRRVAADLSDMFCYAIKHLGAYEKTEPDFTNAVGAASFDAKRYGDLCRELALAIPELKKRLDLAFSGAAIERKGLEEVSNALAFHLVRIVAVMDQRRQRIKSATPPKKH